MSISQNNNITLRDFPRYERRERDFFFHLSLRKIHMKTILIVLVGVLVWTNNDARTFTSKALYRAAEFVSPEPETRSIGETIDEIFSR